MKIHVADHPLITHKLTLLRDETTNSPTFRQLTEELEMLLAYEATREIRTEPKEIKTPVTKMTGEVLTKPRPVVVPILRAGLGMLEGMTRLIPTPHRRIQPPLAWTPRRLSKRTASTAIT